MTDQKSTSKRTAQTAQLSPITPSGYNFQHTPAPSSLLPYHPPTERSNSDYHTRRLPSNLPVPSSPGARETTGLRQPQRKKGRGDAPPSSLQIHQQQGIPGASPWVGDTTPASGVSRDSKFPKFMDSPTLSAPPPKTSPSPPPRGTTLDFSASPPQQGTTVAASEDTALQRAVADDAHGSGGDREGGRELSEVAKGKQRAEEGPAREASQSESVSPDRKVTHIPLNLPPDLSSLFGSFNAPIALLLARALTETYNPPVTVSTAATALESVLRGVAAQPRCRLTLEGATFRWPESNTRADDDRGVLRRTTRALLDRICELVLIVLLFDDRNGRATPRDPSELVGRLLAWCSPTPDQLKDDNPVLWVRIVRQKIGEIGGFRKEIFSSGGTDSSKTFVAFIRKTQLFHYRRHPETDSVPPPPNMYNASPTDPVALLSAVLDDAAGPSTPSSTNSSSETLLPAIHYLIAVLVHRRASARAHAQELEELSARDRSSTAALQARSAPGGGTAGLPSTSADASTSGGTAVEASVGTKTSEKVDWREGLPTSMTAGIGTKVGKDGVEGLVRGHGAAAVCQAFTKYNFRERQFGWHRDALVELANSAFQITPRLTKRTKKEDAVEACQEWANSSSPE